MGSMPGRGRWRSATATGSPRTTRVSAPRGALGLLLRQTMQSLAPLAAPAPFVLESVSELLYRATAGLAGRHQGRPYAQLPVQLSRAGRLRARPRRERRVGEV